MKHLVLVCVPAIFILGVAAACGGDEPSTPTTPGAPPSGSNTNTTGRSLITIQVGDNAFGPSNLTVPAGTKVTWDWGGKNPHSVVGSWQSAAVQSQQFSRTGSFEFTFNTSGTFAYECGVHGAAMAGKITIKP